MKSLYSLFSIILLLTMLIAPKQALSVDKHKMSLEDIKQDLPKMLGANNVGKEFYFSIPPCFEDESAGFANFIRIYVTSSVKTLVTIEVTARGYFKTQNTIPNDVIEFDITPVQGQPYVKDGHGANVPEDVFRGMAVHMYADQPFVSYACVRYHWTSDCWLNIPVSSLGREYIVTAMEIDPMFRAIWGYKLPCVTCISSPYDDNKVRFTLGGNTLTNTAGGMKPGDTKEFNLMKGDVAAISGDADMSDLTGSKIVSTKPVCVVTGQQCSNIPVGNQWCDYTGECEIPDFTWGLDVHEVKIPQRKFSSMVKIVAKEPNTKLYRNGKQIGMIPQSGGTSGNGYQEYPNMTPDTKPNIVHFSGDKPIQVTLYNHGTQEDGYTSTQSDPFTMTSTPVQQYQKYILFCTPGILGGAGFAINYVNVVYETNEFGMCPDSMWFSGPIHGGQLNWTQLNVKYPSVDLIFQGNVNGKQYACKIITLPGDGVYAIKSNTAFAAYSFGFSDYDSYGMPTAAALADLTKPDTVPPNPTWVIGCDGNISNGVVTDMPDDNAIRSNLSMIVFQTDFSYNYEFKYDDFVPGDTRTTHWTLTVIDPSQDARAIITFSDRRGNDTTIEIDYHATKLTIQPTLVDFGNFKTNETKTIDFVVTNLSTTSADTVTKLMLKSGSQGFTLNYLTPLPYVLGPGESQKFTVTFTATTEGNFQDSIGLGNNCLFFNKTLVKATVGNPIIVVTDVAFSILSVGLTSTLPFHITNEGTVDLIITGYTGPNLPCYTTTDLPVINANNPLTVHVGETQSYTIKFAPTTVGVFLDTMVFISDAGTNRKNYCLISGQSMTPQLQANDCPWPPLRITRPAKPTGPYDPLNGYRAIVLKNPGSQPVYVSGINITTDDKGYAFEFDRASLTNMTIQALDSAYIPVKFHPDVPGTYKLVFSYQNTANSTTTTTLTGTGILPKISTYDYDFGTTIIQSMQDMQTRKIVFKNNKYQTDGVETSDSVTIDNFIESSLSDIGLDGVSFTGNAWTYDKKALLPPSIVIQPGDSIEFDAKFIAQVPGAITSTLTTQSDAETEVVSHWSGFGVSQRVDVQGGSVTICKGKTDSVNCTIQNKGTANVTVTSIQMDPMLGYVYFMNPTDQSGFVLSPGAQRIVTIGYTPSKAGTDNVNIIFNTDIEGKNSDTALVTVTAVEYSRNTTIHSSVTPDANHNSRPTPGADNINLSLTLDGIGDLTMAAVTGLQITINYNGGIIQYIKGSAKLGAMVPGWTIDNTLVNDTLGRVTFWISNHSNQVLNGVGEVLSLSFATFLPTSKDLSDATSFLAFIKDQSSGSCLTIVPDSSGIKLDQTCAYDLRSFLVVSRLTYALNAISPNPIGSGGGNLDFTVGLDGQTTLTLINTMGENVRTLFDGNTKAGEYSIALPIEDLPSGMYWVTMRSGMFNDKKQLIIAK